MGFAGGGALAATAATTSGTHSAGSATAIPSAFALAGGVGSASLSVWIAVVLVDGRSGARGAGGAASGGFAGLPSGFGGAAGDFAGLPLGCAAVALGGVVGAGGGGGGSPAGSAGRARLGVAAARGFARWPLALRIMARNSGSRRDSWTWASRRSSSDLRSDSSIAAACSGGPWTVYLLSRKRRVLHGE